MKKNHVELLSVILSGITAIIGIILCVLHFIYKSTNLLLILYTLCAFFWCLSFILMLIRYRISK